MKACNVKPNAQTLNLLVTRYAGEENLEMAVHHLLSAPRHNIVPDLQTVQSVIILAARNNFARLALDLANWFERISTRRLEESVWVNCLIAAAETSYVRIPCHKIEPPTYDPTRLMESNNAGRLSQKISKLSLVKEFAFRS